MQPQTTKTPATLRATTFDTKALELLPAADDLASLPLTVDPADPEFAAPALTNQWSGLIAGREPFAYSGWSTPELFHESVQAETFLSLNGAPLKATRELFNPLTYRWYPGRIERKGRYQNLDMKVTTSLSTRQQVVMNQLELDNLGSEDLHVDLFIRLTSDIRAEWNTTDWPPPESAVGSANLQADSGQLLISSPRGNAFAAAGMNHPLKSAAGFAREDARWHQALNNGQLDGHLVDQAAQVVLHYQLRIPANQSLELHWSHAIASTEAEARNNQTLAMKELRDQLAQTQADWQDEWRAAFTQDSHSFSGHCAVLSADNPKLARLYYMGIMTLLQCKRTCVFGNQAQVYVTGFPSSTFTFHNNWVFPWDAMMVSGVLSQLDPEAMKTMLELWLHADLHAGCAVDFLNGSPVGYWYAVNDYALIHMVWQYTRYTGDYDFLDREIRGETVLEHLVNAALYYRRIADSDGLADYGGANNLLECVSTYTHKVASFNAANVWNLRTVAGMLEQRDQQGRAQELRELASDLVPKVQSLYVEGDGVWSCLQPNGERVVVRHCLDFHTVAQCMKDELSEQQKREMTAFFMRELKTETWMHALSPLDPDTTFSSRTDHQDEGAYTTWPAYAFEVLMDFGLEDEAMDWLGNEDRPGFADVTNQGPFGQAYNHGDEGSYRLAGAGSKAPMEEPHIEKPVLVPGGKYAQIVIETVAGIQPSQFGPVELRRESPATRLNLHNLLLRGSNHALESQG